VLCPNSTQQIAFIGGHTAEVGPLQEIWTPRANVAAITGTKKRMIEEGNGKIWSILFSGNRSYQSDDCAGAIPCN
jgi:hypothetical protein